MIIISTILSEDIEQHFRNHLPPQAVKLLILMNEQNQALEKTINEQHRLMMKMAQYLILTHKSDDMIKSLKQFEKDAQQRSPLATEHIEEKER